MPDTKGDMHSELAAFTDMALANISIMGLNKLLQADLLSMKKQGHRYFRFSRDEVAYAIEGLANLASQGELQRNGKKMLPDFQYCRACYDHVAGRVGTMLTDYLLQKNSCNLTRKNNLTWPQKANIF